MASSSEPRKLQELPTQIVIRSIFIFLILPLLIKRHQVGIDKSTAA